MRDGVCERHTTSGQWQRLRNQRQPRLCFWAGGAGGGTRGARSSDTGASVLRVYIHSENLGNANAAGSQLSIAGEWNIDSKLSGFEQQ